MWYEIMSRIVRWLDPKLEKYRVRRKGAQNKPEKYTPKTMEDFIGVIQRMPKTLLSQVDRERIAAVMSYDNKRVVDLMTPKEKMVFVNEKDFLGPLMLDKLYKSGFTNFPVVDNNNRVKGIIHTEALNALEIKKTDRASKYMEKFVSYLHTNDSLEKAVEEIKRTNSFYYLVLDGDEKLAGFFTTEMLLAYLLGM